MKQENYSIPLLDACVISPPGAIMDDSVLSLVNRVVGQLVEGDIENFAAERNKAINKSDAEWSLTIDTDESIEYKKGYGPDDIREILLHSKAEAFYIPIRSKTPTGVSIGTQPRIFRHGRVRYIRSIQNLPTGFDASKCGIIERMTIVHSGYEGDQTEKLLKRDKMYLKALENNPMDGDLWYYYAKHCMLCLRWFEAVLTCKKSRDLLGRKNIPWAKTRYMELWAIEARCLAEQGEFAKAVDVCDEGTAIAPRYYDLKYLKMKMLEVWAKRVEGVWLAERELSREVGIPSPYELVSSEKGVEGHIEEEEK